jgi:hypothetical protein
MDRATRYALDEERNKIEAVIHAYAALDNWSEGDHTLTQEQKDEYLDTIRGVNFPRLARRYIEIQNLQWDDALGRPSTAGTLNQSVPDADYREIVAPPVQ